MLDRDQNKLRNFQIPGRQNLLDRWHFLKVVGNKFGRNKEIKGNKVLMLHVNLDLVLFKKINLN